MTNISFISETTVRPTGQVESMRRVELTPWDLQLFAVDYIQRGLLFVKPKHQEKHGFYCSLVDHLRTSLSRTLVFFFPLAGRLDTTFNDDGTTCFFINCSGAGAQFIHAAARGVAVADVFESRVVHPLFPLNGVRNGEGVSQPLLGVQVTELDDGVFIACSANHMVMDGFSFWHFFNSWSEISRGYGKISRSPILKRWFVDGTDYPIRIPNSSAPVCGEFIPSPYQERVFHFTKEKIAVLKARANAEIGGNGVSSLQSVLAHLWRSVIRNKHIPEDEEISYKLIVGMRPRLRPPLPEQYLGNAVQIGTVTMKAGELLERGLGRAAWEMNKTVATISEVEAINFLEAWAKNPKFVTSSSTMRNALSTGSSPRFNVYGNDFGWGKPVAVRSGGGNKSDGKLTVYPGREEGSIDIEGSLKEETLVAMLNDAEFMEEVTLCELPSF